jgi:hypothetical protein
MRARSQRLPLHSQARAAVRPQQSECVKLNAHIWQREANGHYVEPPWVSRRLFEVERFTGPVHDPACGFGNVVRSARDAGLEASGADLVDRGFGSELVDFLSTTTLRANIVCNPPFDLCQEFAEHALRVAARKVAMISLVRRLNAARWLQDTPLARIWLLTPRPSMPPGHVIARGDKPGGGTQDFCWLVWEHGRNGEPEIGWLKRGNSL